MKTDSINISTKFIPKKYLTDEAGQKEFFGLMGRFGYGNIHFDFNRFEPQELFDERKMYGLFDIIAMSGIRILNSHLIVNPYENIWDNNDKEKEEKIWKSLDKCLKYNNDLSIGDTVYHVPELRHFDVYKCQKFISVFPGLLDLSAKYGCRICLENHYNAQVDNFVLPYMFQKYSENVLGFTFDLGHCFLSKNEKIFDNDFYRRLSLIHLNDNDRRTDLHRIPDVNNNEEKWLETFAKIKKNQNGAMLIFEIGQDEMKHSDNLETALWELHEKLVGVMEFYRKI